MNPQPFKFNSYDDFLDHLTQTEKQLVHAMDELVATCAPQARRKLSYNVPFYSLNRRLCFIWPASVPWGKVPLQGVQFGFCEGHLLLDEEGFLDRGARKQVFSKTYFDLSAFLEDEAMLRHFLFEAVEVDRRFAKKSAARK